MYRHLVMASTLYLAATVASAGEGKSPVNATEGNTKGRPAVEIQIVKPQAKDSFSPSQDLLVEGRIRVSEDAAPPGLIVLYVMAKRDSKGKVSKEEISHGMSILKIGETKELGSYIKHGDKEFQFTFKMKGPSLVGKYEVYVEGIHADPAAAKSVEDMKITRYNSPRQQIEVK